MNIHAKTPTTSEEFLRWNEGREGKREFVKGKVVEQMMINVTRHHYFLAARLWSQLTAQLGLKEFIIGSADFGVLTPDGVRYPDILIEKAGGIGTDLATREPLFLAEILSPSTMADDFGPKAREYLSIPTLRHYLIVAQNERRVWVWSRSSEQNWIGPQIFDSAAATISLEGFDVLIDLEELYSGIVDPS